MAKPSKHIPSQTFLGKEGKKLLINKLGYKNAEEMSEKNGYSPQLWSGFAPATQSQILIGYTMQKFSINSPVELFDRLSLGEKLEKENKVLVKKLKKIADEAKMEKRDD